VAGVLYLCSECDVYRHSGAINALHTRDLFCLNTHGFKPAPLIPVTLQLSTCTVCNAPLKAGGSCLDQALIKTVTMQTLKGHVQATVVPVKCGKCNNIIGRDPSEYNCLDGAESIWFHKDLLDLDLKYFIESQFQ